MQLYTTFTAARFLIFSLRSAAIRRRDDAFTHHEPPAVRNRLPGTISDIRTISNFPDGVNRHSPQIQPRNFYLNGSDPGCVRYILASRAVICGKQPLRASAHKKRQPMPTIHVLPPFYPIIYVIFPGHMTGSYLSFEARATRPLSARSARTFGMTISPLKKSARDHTSSSFRQEPITMQTTTIRE